VARNKTRDKLVQRVLRDGGWQVIVIWECNLRLGAQRAQRILTPERK
jgi:G:T-mismatch repair DNA endonuclease (very short patch repair protein)